MENKKTIQTKEALEKKFHKGFRWNLVGSIIYEILKTLHYFLLLRFLQTPVYGLIGSMFSIIYFTTKLADVGTTYSLPPFFHLFFKSKNNFKRLFFKYFLLPQAPIILLSSFIATFFYYQKFLTTQTPPYLFILPTLIILETLRSFLRYFLHFAFQSKTIIFIELTSFIGYLASIWVLFFGGAFSLSLNLIFLPHIIDSTIVVTIFSYVTKQTLSTSLIFCEDCQIYLRNQKSGVTFVCPIFSNLNLHEQ